MGDTPANGSIADAIESARAVFEPFPDHWRIASRAIELLAVDERVSGMFLSGSFAKGKPDRWSDIDFYIVATPDSSLEELIGHQDKLIREVAEIATVFPATHLRDPHQVIAFYKASEPIHVDYQYRKLGWLIPRRGDRNVVIVFDRSGDLERWRQACEEAPLETSISSDQLSYLEIRFWGWCWYAHTKIERGELWEARDVLEYLRSNVLVTLAHNEGQVLEGNRRLEQKLRPDIQELLATTIPASHTPSSYRETLDRIVDAYLELFQQIPAAASDGVALVDSDYFMRAIAKARGARQSSGAVRKPVRRSS